MDTKTNLWEISIKYCIIMNMNAILLVVIVLQFAFMVYSDIQNRRERELLQLKLMSDNLTDYKSALEDTPKDSPRDEEDPYISMDEANIEQIIKAKEKA